MLQQHEVPLPAVAGATLSMTMLRSEILDAGVDPAQLHVAWVKTGSGHLLRSQQAFTLVPESVPTPVQHPDDR